MPYKDIEKKRACARRYAERHREKMREYAKKYNASPKGKAYHAEYYLQNREKMLKAAKENRLFKRYKDKTQSAISHRKSVRECARRIRCGIVIDRNEQGFFWKAGKLWNGYFKYKKEAIQDSERAFDL